ncbi:transposase, partial [Methylorubrum populi]
DLLRQNDPTGLTPWLEAAAATDLGGFVAGLRQDEAAVRAAIVEPWSNGPVEGQVNRLKLIKRSMYGRAKFDLLRQRVLHVA